MHLRFILLKGLALAALSAVSAHASCANFTAAPISRTYDPLGAQGAMQIVAPVTLTAASDNGSPASVDAQFVDQNSGTLRIGAGGPVYTISKSLNSVVVPWGAPLNPAFAFHYDFLSLGTRRAEPVSGLKLYIDPGQDVPAGVYHENLDIQFQCSSASGSETQAGVLQIVVDVPSTLTASLAGGASTGTVDFGDFSAMTQTVLVGVYSTGPYALTIDSTNAQVMKLTNAPGAAVGMPNTQIPYTMTFNGASVSSAATHFPRTGVGGAQLPLSITAATSAGKRAGVYRDTVTVTFTPLATL